MAQYAFILGTNAPLSTAEICAVLPKAKIIACESGFLCVEQNAVEDPQLLLDRLGGTIKMYEIRHQLSAYTTQIVEDIELGVQDILEANPVEGKLPFAVNLYGKTDKQLQKHLIMQAKRHLRLGKISCRFVNTDFQNTTSVQSYHEKLAYKGVEIGVLFSRERIFVTQLVATQNIEMYTWRDMGKPERNMKVGLMPPKLAQILINLTGLPPGKIIYDPFCGTGGILSEGLLWGYHCYGSDLHEDILEQARRNLDWLIREMPDTGSLVNNLFQQDATRMDNIKFHFDAMVTENYLGPPMEKALNADETEKYEEHLAHVYVPFFENLKKHVKKDTPLIVCLPVFLQHQQPVFLSNTLARILELGYTASALIPENIQQTYSLRPTARNSLLYYREGQLVGREIFRLNTK